ncbi:MAG: polysaccharide deacetylase family protein [Ferruginibacter sp.]|nr:polysaccharide deacetylase family protein [Ferruginibacter sp.]
MFYLAKTPNWVSKLFKESTWAIPDAEKTIYLTFDDGPHPLITPFVLKELDKFGAKATFFCIGKNVAEYPDVFKSILEKGHSVGNHTHNHLNGWKTPNAKYLQNILEARSFIDSDLFRPPYGRMTSRQKNLLLNLNKPFKVIMWSVLSGDFDINLTPEKCLDNVIKYSQSGSVVVFHDSEKAYERLLYTLPLMLKYFSEKGFKFEKIEG